MNRAGAALLAGATLLASTSAGAHLLGAATAAAQTVQGTVIGIDDGSPISDALVRLVDTAAVAVDSSTTDVRGAFRVTAPGPGRYLLDVRREGYLSYSSTVRLTGADTVRRDVEMPVVSVAAARVMQEVIDRETAFQLPLEELCEEPLRPWEAGVLVGVARDRDGLEPVAGAVVRIEPDRHPARRRVATATGGFWFCNVPAGRVRVITRAAGFRTDTSFASIRSGTISWYDALLRRR